MSRAEVLDLPRPAMREPHDLHRGRARRGLHCPHVRHQATLRAAPSAQIQLSRTTNPQVSAPRHRPRPNRGPTRGSRTGSGAAELCITGPLLCVARGFRARSTVRGRGSTRVPRGVSRPATPRSSVYRSIRERTKRAASRGRDEDLPGQLAIAQCLSESPGFIVLLKESHMAIDQLTVC